MINVHAKWRVEGSCVVGKPTKYEICKTNEEIALTRCNTCIYKTMGSEALERDCFKDIELSGNCVEYMSVASLEESKSDLRPRRSDGWG